MGIREFELWEGGVRIYGKFVGTMKVLEWGGKAEERVRMSLQRAPP